MVSNLYSKIKIQNHNRLQANFGKPEVSMNRLLAIVLLYTPVTSEVP